MVGGPKAVQSTTNAPSRSQESSPLISLDILIAVLFKTIFHPFIACLLPFCLRALAAPYTSISFISTSVFAACVCVYHLLVILNQRFAYGPPRKIDWEDEVVVITGGCGGLGGCIAEIYGLRGVTVVVLDIAVSPKDHGVEKEGVYYYRCDLSQFDQIEDAWRRVTKDLGTPTILINNAAHMSANSVWNTSTVEVEMAFRVNAISHFITTKLFLSGLGPRRGGTLVTISSVLGQLCAANLAAYCASKAAITAYHQSLTAELAMSTPKIKTILVAPGQLDTKMFAHVKTQGWLQKVVGPAVAAGALATEIVGTIDAGNSGEIRMPFFANWAVIIAVLPMSIQRGLRWWSGMDQAFDWYLEDQPNIDAYSDSESDEESSSSDESSSLSE